MRKKFFSAFAVALTALSMLSSSVFAEEAVKSIEVDLSSSLVQSSNYDYGQSAAEFTTAQSQTGRGFLTSTENDLGEVVLRIENAIKAYQTNVDVSGLTFEFNDASNELMKIINDHPEYFYVTGYLGYSSRGGVATIELRFDDTSANAADNISARVMRFNSGAAAYLNGIDSSWTDEQKLLYLHDKMVIDCKYDSSLSKYSAYDIFVDKTAVCNGYTMAYRYLLNKLGINNTMVNSKTLNHIWNVAEVDGKEYLIDVTWDDPTNAPLSYCGHTYFLKSESAFGHEANDWMFQSGSRDKTSAKNAFNDTRYNNSWVSGIEPYTINGTWCSVSGSNHYRGTAATLTVPSSINSTSVTVINRNFLWSNRTLSSLRLPDTATSVSADAFYDCADRGLLHYSPDRK